MAAHNASYDQRVLETNLTKAGIALPKWEWQNTIPIFERVFQNPDGNRLDELCKKYLDKPKTEHRAKGDVENLKTLMDLAAKRVDPSKSTSYIWGYFFSQK